MADRSHYDIARRPTAGYGARFEALQMTPASGARLLQFVGDRVRFELSSAEPVPQGSRAFLRTTLGQDSVLRRRAMMPMTGERITAGADWRNIPMKTIDGRVWWVECTMTEPGFFWVKSYFVQQDGQTYWPEGENIGVSVHSAVWRSGNTIYCAFPRLFGETRTYRKTRGGLLDTQFQAFDQHGYTLIPPSGTLRDVTRQLPHIIQRLGCRILHLLPVHPTPTVFARMGRYGSPYAALDMTGIDPSLVEFDHRTTGVDQFCELTRETHHLGGRVMLDIVINHTGWASVLHETHPEWFVRQDNGEFKSPGAWGVVWGDLVELNQSHVSLWQYIADSLLVWCRRGVDGFRCDAGYMIPLQTWNAITARIREEFPETVFLLEGLGGAWSATETLLTQGRMQWAYSELFQNFDGPSVASYLDHSIYQNSRVGIMVHYSETHDNPRLAEKGKDWSLLRNRLCALASHSGAFGFTCGVEWLATERVDVHECHGLNWDAADNIVDELAALNRLLQSHPCFHEHTRCRRLSRMEDPVYVLERCRDDIESTPMRLIVVANTDLYGAHDTILSAETAEAVGMKPHDLLGQTSPFMRRMDSGELCLTIPTAAVYCLSSSEWCPDENGQMYRHRRNRHGMAIRLLSTRFFPEDIGLCDWRVLADLLDGNPRSFLGAISRVSRTELADDPVTALQRQMVEDQWDPVTVWKVPDQHRITPVPALHWLMVHHSAPFRILFRGEDSEIHQASVHIDGGHIAVLPPESFVGDVIMEMDSLHLSTADGKGEPDKGMVRGTLRFLHRFPDVAIENCREGLLLLTNGRGGMARLHADFGAVHSKYDCVLAINDHPDWPVDRHILVKRVRAWLVSDGFSQPLNRTNLDGVTPGTSAGFHFTAGACGGYSIGITVTAQMVPMHNTTVMVFRRERICHPADSPFPQDSHLDLILRVDLENRNFHQETLYASDADAWFRRSIVAHPEGRGFAFHSGHTHPLQVVVSEGLYIQEPEWCTGIGHPMDAERGQRGSGDCFSPGWFKVDMRHQEICVLSLDADAFWKTTDDTESLLRRMDEASLRMPSRASTLSDGASVDDRFGQTLIRSAADFVVKRETGKTVIAGYPWFLDWGRDTLICARGLLSMGYLSEVEEILQVFGQYVDNGTLPNCIHGADVSNRDTSDAPLWYNLVIEELVSRCGESCLTREDHRLIRVIENIARGYIKGTANGIGMDEATGLIFSPSHFTWMDTNFPAGTPREGYPVEIQALWIRLLDHLTKLGVSPPGSHLSWAELSRRARQSFIDLFWDEDSGYLADCIRAERRAGARSGVRDTSLRPNGLLAVTLEIVTDDMARRTVLAALHHLIVPGAIRSLAPMEVEVPLSIYGNGGHLLNNPQFPYWGQYTGDEDSLRKPAYHNGTAWTWPFPLFCEALARAWKGQPAVRQSALAYLSSMDALLRDGCLGHLPEILDGNAPHAQRGCDAQAWGITEAFRVWRWLTSLDGD